MRPINPTEPIHYEERDPVLHPDHVLAWDAELEQHNECNPADFSDSTNEDVVPWDISEFGSEARLDSKLRSLARVTQWGVEFDVFADDEFNDAKFIDDIGEAFDEELDELLAYNKVEPISSSASNLLSLQQGTGDERLARPEEGSADFIGSAETRTLVALQALGRPATKDEIAELSGLSPERVGTCFWALPDVVRADKTRWGFAVWIEDEYEGIPAEIVQRIVEDGGSTRLNRLLDELPRLFGVSETSVRACIASNAFRLENGWVSQVTHHDVVIGELDDVVDGRDIHGDPYWIFEVHERNLRGHSIRGIPAEIAVSLGCEWGQKTTAAVRNPHPSPDVSVIWRPTSPAGPEMGRVSSPLKAISACDGKTACLVLHEDGDVSIVLKPELPPDRRNPQKRTPPKSFIPTSTTSERFYRGVKLGKPVKGMLKNTAKDGVPTTSDTSTRALARPHSEEC